MADGLGTTDERRQSNSVLRAQGWCVPGPAGKRFIFERAKQLGVRSVIIDGPESWSQVGVGLAGWMGAAGSIAGARRVLAGLGGCCWLCRDVLLSVAHSHPALHHALRVYHHPVQELVKEGIVSKFIGLDMSDADTVFERCLEAIEEVNEVGGAGDEAVGGWVGG